VEQGPPCGRPATRVTQSLFLKVVASEQIGWSSSRKEKRWVAVRMQGNLPSRAEDASALGTCRKVAEHTQ